MKGLLAELNMRYFNSANELYIYNVSVLPWKYSSTLAEVLRYSAGSTVECWGSLSLFVHKKAVPERGQTDVSSDCVLFSGTLKYLFIPIAYRFKFGFFSTSLGG